MLGYILNLLFANNHLRDNNGFAKQELLRKVEASGYRLTWLDRLAL